jgi:WD40 repeat protein
MERLPHKSTGSYRIQPCLFLLLPMRTSLSESSISRQVHCFYLFYCCGSSAHIGLGQCTHSMPAHLDGVTSLSIDASGFSLVSGSHDCSLRFWDLLGSRSCVQELSTHREKAREGVLDVQFHPSLPFLASGGADGVVKLYASS